MGNVNFADNEISRIKSFFANFCKSVEVMKDEADHEKISEKIRNIAV